MLRFVFVASSRSYLNNLQAGEKVFGMNHWHSLMAKAGVSLLLVSLATALACAMHLYFEVPIMRILRRTFLTRELAASTTVQAPQTSVAP